MNKPNQSITGIAEIALRIHDLDLMRRFYEQVIGLEVLREIKDSNGKAIFYAVGAGNDHLALFEAASRQRIADAVNVKDTAIGLLTV